MNTDFLKKIAELKKETGKMSKDSTNPFFNSKYFDINQLLEHLEPICHAKNLLILQPIINDEVQSQIIDLDSGERIQSAIKLPQLNDPQKVGGAITYYRRYGLQSLLGLQAEDDDGNKASGKATPKNGTAKKTESSNDDKPWLNLMDKNGNRTKVFTDILHRQEKEQISLATLKKHYRISKNDVEILASVNIL